MAVDGTSGNVDHLIAVRGQRRSKLDEAARSPATERILSAIERVRPGEEHPATWFVGVGMTSRDVKIAVKEGWLIRVERGYYVRVA